MLEALAFDSGRTEVAMSEIQLCNWEDNKSQKAATTAVEVFKQYNLCILIRLEMLEGLPGEIESFYQYELHYSSNILLQFNVHVP